MRGGKAKEGAGVARRKWFICLGIVPQSRSGMMSAAWEDHHCLAERRSDASEFARSCRARVTDDKSGADGIEPRPADGHVPGQIQMVMEAWSRITTSAFARICFRHTFQASNEPACMLASLTRNF